MVVNRLARDAPARRSDGKFECRVVPTTGTTWLPVSIAADDTGLMCAGDKSITLTKEIEPDRS